MLAIAAAMILTLGASDAAPPPVASTPQECQLLAGVVSSLAPPAKGALIEVVGDPSGPTDAGDLLYAKHGSDFFRQLKLTPAETAELGEAAKALPRDPWRVDCDWSARGIEIRYTFTRVTNEPGAVGTVRCDAPAPPMQCGPEVTVPAQGLSFGRPIVGRSGTVALVSYGHHCGPLCGSGGLCVVRREPDAQDWTAICLPTWIS